VATFKNGDKVRIKGENGVATVKDWWQAKTYGGTTTANGAKKYLVELPNGKTRYCMTKELERA
jgi:hypothetical protein